MAAKKRGGKRKKKKTPHSGRAAAANPPKRKKKRKASKRASAANPPRKRKKARHGGHHATRARASNPGHKRRKRRHRSNPDVPVWAMAAVGAVLGLVSFTAVSAGTFALTQRLDPSLGTLVRNRRIAAGLFTLGGIGLAFISPILGAGVAAGGLAVLAGTEASLAIGGLIDKPAAASASSSPAGTQVAARRTVNGVFGAGTGRQQLGMGGVFDGRQQQFAGVFGNGGHQAFGGLDDVGDYGATAF